VRIIVRGIGNLPTNFAVSGTFRLWANTCQTDHVTSSPWPLTLEVMALPAMRLFMFQLSTKFQVRTLSVRKIWRTFCFSTSRPGDLDLWSLIFKVARIIARTIGNLATDFGVSGWDFSFSIYGLTPGVKLGWILRNLRWFTSDLRVPPLALDSLPYLEFFTTNIRRFGWCFCTF